MIRLALCAGALVAGTPALAIGPVSIRAEAVSDLRERGLGQSGGRAATALRGSLDVASGFSIDAAAFTTRDSARHGGADAGVELAVNHRSSLGAVTLDGGVVGRAFPGGAGSLDYLEGYATASVLIGPAELGGSVFYAPAQDAIGGSNLYLRARARVAVVGTPLTLTAHLGRSSGDVDDRLRAARLRPAGSYVDWGLGADYSIGPAMIGLVYTDTDVTARQVISSFGDRRHTGAKLAARVALSF